MELTDGGHFENLGVYELVRRGCKVIIACDAGADPDFKYADLGNAVEKVRTDFGVLIDIKGADLDELVARAPIDRAAGHSAEPVYAKRGFLVAPIIYPYDRNNPGVFIYLKPTILQDLSSDVYAYKAAHSSFPAQSTADQWFDEKQFEAYRELGFKVTYSLLECFIGRSTNALAAEEQKRVDQACSYITSRHGGALWSEPAADAEGGENPARN